MDWSKLPLEEIERRRLTSVEVMERRDRDKFDRWYQELCDRDYWTRGQCCAGCDHWSSEAGMSGTCSAGGIVSGRDVAMSIADGGFCSYTPPPGYPYRKSDHWCSLFKDDFDWSTLDDEYLRRIGAISCGKLKQKPMHVRSA